MFKLVVLSVVLAVVAASPNGVWGGGLATPLGSAWGAQLATGVVGSLAAPIASPLTAPIAAVGAPIGAKIVQGNGHWLKKRSILAGPVLATSIAATPLAANWVASAPVAVATPITTQLVAPVAAVAAPIGVSNYRGPLSLAPGQPANILAADGRPLDTISVNLDRAIHNTAKVVEGNGHWLKKRSILAGPVVATPIAATPLAANWLASAPVAVAAPIATPLAAPIPAVAAPVSASNYRGPLSLAPGQPANILASDGRPLDTLSVNLDRAIHYTAKAVEGNGHWLKKRSIVAAPLAAAPPATALVVATSLAAPLTTSWVAPAPVTVAGAAPWGLGVGARVGHLW